MFTSGNSLTPWGVGYVYSLQCNRQYCRGQVVLIARGENRVTGSIFVALLKLNFPDFSWFVR
jgi:hypothetical protein